MKKHPGFKGAQKRIAAKEGIPMKNAGAILASSSRKASAKAKRANPRLNKVRGKTKAKGRPSEAHGKVPARLLTKSMKKMSEKRRANLMDMPV